MANLNLAQNAMNPGSSKPAMFAVAEQRFNGQHYPYDEVIKYYETAQQAVDYIIEDAGQKNAFLRLKRPFACPVYINLLKTGEIFVVPAYENPIYKDGEWVDKRYDPRNSDPEFVEYLRLKEKFDE